MNANKIVICTGGYDPVHRGHLEFFKAAKQLGDKLIVGVNSDEWLTRKKGKPFMSFEERAAIIEEFKCVDKVIGFNDLDDTACDAIEQVLHRSPPDTQIIFANGGDRLDTNTPEYIRYRDNKSVTFEFGVGGFDKINSSSKLLDEWKHPKVERKWGWYRVLDEKPGYKIKELVIEPGKSLSDQKHNFRSEQWYVLKGICHMETEHLGMKKIMNLHELTSGYTIGQGVWHKAANHQSSACHVLEVQYGEKCVEEDIERRD